jgi:hypothetical protein
MGVRLFTFFYIPFEGNALNTLSSIRSYATFWQYADSGENPGDADLFNGDSTGLSE